MCRLFAYTSKHPRSPRSVFGEKGINQLIQLSYEHCNGWGQASKTSAGFTVTRSPQAAHASSAFNTHLDAPVTSTMIHLRQASSTMSKHVAHNHPFTTSQYAFCHNGYFKHHEKIIDFLGSKGIILDDQATDTEAYFALMQFYARQHSIPEALVASARHILSVCHTDWLALNTLVMDNQYLYAFNFYRADSPPALEKPTRYKMHYQQTSQGWAVGSEGVTFPDETSPIRWMKQGQILRVQHDGTGLTDVTV